MVALGHCGNSGCGVGVLAQVEVRETGNALGFKPSSLALKLRTSASRTRFAGEWCKNEQAAKRPVTVKLVKDFLP